MTREWLPRVLLQGPLIKDAQCNAMHSRCACLIWFLIRRIFKGMQSRWPCLALRAIAFRPFLFLQLAVLQDDTLLNNNVCCWCVPAE
jgi:hypothetical protein